MAQIIQFPKQHVNEEITALLQHYENELKNAIHQYNEIQYRIQSITQQMDELYERYVDITLRADSDPTENS